MLKMEQEVLFFQSIQSGHFFIELVIKKFMRIQEIKNSNKSCDTDISFVNPSRLFKL